MAFKRWISTLYRYSCVVFFTGCIMLCITTFVPSVHTAEWDYADASTWGIEFPTCEGDGQSPIDIVDDDSKPSHELPPLIFSYTGNFSCYIINSGHTIQVSFHNTIPPVHLFGGSYHLRQFHFHTPSEHKRNFNQFALELHTVHRDSLTDKILVISTLFELNPTPNPILDTFWKDIPPINSSVPSPVPINPSTMWPKDRSYFFYQGSLTTPPCTGDVNWIVFNQPSIVSQDQVLFLLTKLPERDARPIQKLAGRDLYYIAHSPAETAEQLFNPLTIALLVCLVLISVAIIYLVIYFRRKRAAAQRLLDQKPSNHSSISPPTPPSSTM